MFAPPNGNFPLPQLRNVPALTPVNKKPWKDMGMRRRQYNRMQRNPSFGADNPKIQQLREMMAGMPQQPGAPGLVPPQMSTDPQVGAVTPGIVPPYQQPGYTDKQIGGPGGMPQTGADQISYPGGTPPWVYDESIGGPNPGPQQENMTRLTVEPPMEMGPGFPGGPPMQGGPGRMEGMFNRLRKMPGFMRRGQRPQQLIGNATATQQQQYGGY